ncbi:hypothetical protein MGG_16777 [Pyricularia oryzae 70-15]|uniref:Uncharacterized protein n=3 Tax=Pyricularia oryzae TaxID=318829 RepID=G4N0V0_PYRO7|nr:uncharacterized protein MGG_16777 [Pyricularia oryzae 70-15]EHA52328.1 hypothetical protein MGG_16777 [Pyricularia oryzae 70-15]ELQ36585.1 hypothetical protein OOU_Y34scaffold00653g6 [Pyricularia oryzae Y34]
MHVTSSKSASAKTILKGFRYRQVGSDGAWIRPDLGEGIDGTKLPESQSNFVRNLRE